jgi:hypothetical protein
MCYIYRCYVVKHLAKKLSVKLTLKKLARKWINDTFNNEILLLNSKQIHYLNEKGTVIIKVNVTSNDCLRIASGKIFDLQFKITWVNNICTEELIYSNTLSESQLHEFGVSVSKVRFIDP